MKSRPKVTFYVVRADGGPEVAVAMNSDVLKCGKQGDLALHQDPFVAPTQARFFFSNAGLTVEDVGGGNGTFLRVRRETELFSGGEIRIGRQRLLIEKLPPSNPRPDGTLIWGSPDKGYQFRVIQLLEGGVPGAAFVLKESDNLIGRSSGDIVFPDDAFVSSRHAVLHVRGDRLGLKDLGSSNGTFVRLGAPTFVEDGDQFLIGRELFRVQLQVTSLTVG